MPWRTPERHGRFFKDIGEKIDWWFRSIYKLPFKKFRGVDEEAVWGPLYQRFNTVPMPILDMDAWHADVIELMRSSATVEELYNQMEKRKQQRLDELVTAIHNMRGGVQWFCLPYDLNVRKLGESLFQLLKRPSLFETASVFQTISEITQDAKRERERAREERMKMYKQERKERRRQRRERKAREEAERRARSSLEVDTTSARLSPAQSENSPSSADQPRASEDHMGRSKRKRTHQEKKAEDGREKKRQAMTPRENYDESPINPEAFSSAGSARINADAVLNNNVDVDARIGSKRKRNMQDSDAESGREEKRRAVPPRTSPPSEPPSLGPSSSAASTRSDDDGSSNHEGNDDVGIIGEGETEHDYSTPPSPCESQASGDASDCGPTWHCFRRPERIDYEALGWVRDPGPSDKELCSSAHENLQSTKPLRSGEGRQNIEGVL